MAIKICYRTLFYYEDKYLTDASSRGRNARISTVEFPVHAWLRILCSDRANPNSESAIRNTLKSFRINKSITSNSEFSRVFRAARRATSCGVYTRL